MSAMGACHPAGCGGHCSGRLGQQLLGDRHRESPPARSVDGITASGRSMTLVITAIFPTVVLQASDRRVTYLQGGRTISADNERNKAVLYCNRVAFSYTGAAEIFGVPTDE